MRLFIIFLFLILAASANAQNKQSQDSIYVPNVLSPNSETEYIFAPKGIQSDWEMTIYNRWGEKMFEGKNQGWDATFKQKPVSEGVYVYIIVYYKAEEKVSFTGNLTVIR